MKNKAFGFFYLGFFAFEVLLSISSSTSKNGLHNLNILSNCCATHFYNPRSHAVSGADVTEGATNIFTDHIYSVLASSILDSKKGL